MLRKCVQCEQEKTLVNFSRDKTRKDGKNPRCKYCVSVNLAAKYGVPKEKVKKINYEVQVKYGQRPEVMAKRRERARNHRLSMTPEQIEAKRMTTAEWRKKSPRTAISANLFLALRRRPTANPITLDEAMEIWFSQNGECSVTGIKMTWRQGKVMPTSISMDRIDPSIGYEKGNIRFICHAVNLFKSTGTDAEMLVMARAIIAKADESEPSWRGFGYSANDHILMVH